MPLNIQYSREDNGSVSIELNLQSYLPLFLRSKNNNPPLTTAERDQLHMMQKELDKFFTHTDASVLFWDIQDFCLDQYSPAEQKELRNSPAVDLLRDSLKEMFKNSIDIFLDQQLKHPNTSNTTLKCNFNIEKSMDNAIVTFADSGPGFSNDFMQKLNTEEKQIAYMNSGQFSDKRGQGFTGGHARGLRELIHQILTGQMMRAGHSKTQRATHFDSEIHFSNNHNAYCHGACVEIITQLAPVPEEHSQAKMSPVSSNNSTRPGSKGSEHTASVTSFDSSDFESEFRSQYPDKLGLSIDIEPSNHDRFRGDSPIPQKKSGLSFEIDSFDDSAFAGTSPDLRKQESRKFDSSSPVQQSRKTTASPSNNKKQTAHGLSGRDKLSVPQATHQASTGKTTTKFRDKVVKSRGHDHDVAPSYIPGKKPGK